MQIAVATLQDQFGNKDKLVSSLIREFQNLSIPHHNHSELLNFKLSYEKLVSQIQNLNSLDTNSRFFVEILASKIPAETFKTLVNKYDTTTFTFAQISERLAEIIKVMELCSLQPHSKEVKNVSSTNLSIPVEANQKSSKSKTETSRLVVRVLAMLVEITRVQNLFSVFFVKHLILPNFVLCMVLWIKDIRE